MIGIILGEKTSAPLLLFPFSKLVGSGCLGLNISLRQYFSLYPAVSQSEGERKEIWYAREKTAQTTPIHTFCKHNRPLPSIIQISRLPQLWQLPNTIAYLTNPFQKWRWHLKFTLFIFSTYSKMSSGSSDSSSSGSEDSSSSDSESEVDGNAISEDEEDNLHKQEVTPPKSKTSPQIEETSPLSGVSHEREQILQYAVRSQYLQSRSISQTTDISK